VSKIKKALKFIENSNLELLFLLNKNLYHVFYIGYFWDRIYKLDISIETKYVHIQWEQKVFVQNF